MQTTVFAVLVELRHSTRRVVALSRIYTSLPGGGGASETEKARPILPLPAHKIDFVVTHTCRFWWPQSTPNFLQPVRFPGVE